MDEAGGEEGGTRRPSVPRVPPAPIALSTAAVYPETAPYAFELAARLGYDGVEVMVWNDPVSQDAEALSRLAEHHGVPVLAVHAPCLLITQRVWSPDPRARLERAVENAQRLGARTVVVHPPFRWQREYARGFYDLVASLEASSGLAIAVENMYPWRARGREILAYAPDWDPTDEPYANVTLDLSHTAVSGSDALAMAEGLGERLAHVHLADGAGSPRDEHLVPGRGTQPCGELLERLADRAWDGIVVVEVTTRRARSVEERESDLAESLAFARFNFAAGPVAYAVGSDGSAEAVPRSARPLGRPLGRGLGRGVGRG